MTYEEALAIIKSEFITIHDSDHCAIIKTGLTYDGCNGFCVTIYKYPERDPVLSDIGETKEIFDEVEEEEWKALCAENGLEFNNWRIEKPFTCLEDAYDYINFLDRISDKYFEKYFMDE